MSTYRLNFMGFPFIIFVFYFYAIRLIDQVSSITGETDVIDVVLKLRYGLVAGYFLVCILSPVFNYEYAYAEIPLMTAVLLDGVNVLYNSKEAGLIRFGLLVLVTVMCLYLKRGAGWNVLMNTWMEREDDSDYDEDCYDDENSV